MKAYIEIFTKKSKWKTTPTISWEKPLKGEIKNAKEFGYKIYECEIKIKKEIK
jgi:predicted peroxiredoxin